MDTSLATRLIAAVDASPDCTAGRQLWRPLLQLLAAGARSASNKSPGSAGLSVDQVRAGLAALTDTG
jgi:hypothetical protein